MKIMVLLSNCIPAPRANEICVSKLLSTNEKVTATYICAVNDRSLLGVRQFDPLMQGKIIPFYHKRKKSFSQRSIWGKIGYIMWHLLEVILLPFYDQLMVKRFLQTAEEAIHEDMPDIIIAVLQPTSAVEATRRLKKRYPNLRYVLYDLDTVSDSSLGHFEKLLYPLYYKKTLHWEKKVYRAFDLIVHLDSHEQHFRQQQYFEFLPKTLFQGVPLLEIQKEQERGVLRDKPQLIYAGKFYPTLREPKCLLDGIVLAQKKYSECFTIDIYTDGEYVKKLLEQYSDADGIHVHDFIPQDEINKKMEASDVLISLGNNGTNMFPSKIVTYVALMKPIIHVYQVKDDPVIPYLENYPDALLLDANGDIEENVELIVKFFQKKHKPIHRNTIERIYKDNLPAYNMESIIGHISRDAVDL